MNLIAILEKGGPVVWILAAYSLLGLTIVLERLLHFAQLGPVPQALETELRGASRSRARTLLEPLRGPEGRLLGAMLDAWEQGVADLGRVAVRVGSAELQALERGFRTLGVLGNTAPLLGLFGTITGMIKAFMVIEQAGGRVDAQALAGGIWEALITTGVGLAVALPLLLLLHLLEGMADRRAQSMRSCASLLLEGLPQAGSDDEPVVHHREGVIHAL